MSQTVDGFAGLSRRDCAIKLRICTALSAAETLFQKRVEPCTRKYVNT